nr:MAG TPA: hypothetical protein [Caudoviricetes sp.]
MTSPGVANLAGGGTTATTPFNSSYSRSGCTP